MDPSLVLILLGLNALLLCVSTLDCQRGTIVTTRTVSELPLEWTAGTKTCEIGEGCQDTLMLIENGLQINVLLIKDCTKAEDQQARITRHRAGPGLSVISYTFVCRHGNFCNSLSSTQVLGPLPTPSVPGTLRCPLCLSTSRCENAPEEVCPAGHTHCYDGVLRLRGGGVQSNLRVQGCMPQPGCNLLNGTQKIGPVDMSEDCSPRSGPQALDCNSGNIETIKNVSDLHLSWTTGWDSCDVGEGCYETVLLIDNGQEVNLVITKGCTMAEDKEAEVTRHRPGPGIAFTSYTRVCRHGDFCNDLSTTRSIWTPPPDTVPGTQRCPLCLSTHGCEDAPEHVCPAGQDHCYNGVLKLRGGRVATNLRVQGCMPQPGCSLINGTLKIGPMDVREDCSPRSDLQPLECKSGQLEEVWPVSRLPLQWTTGWETCAMGEGCQETVMFVVNGPQVNLVLTKGCTRNVDHEPQVTHHRAGPGLSVTSYTRVCRQDDFCNDLSTSDILWGQPPVTVPGTLRCPLCLSKSSCPVNASEQVCPAGHTHCYNGVLRLLGGNIATNLRVQGCMPQPGCDLLNGTQKIGAMDVSEDCSPQSVAQALKCQHGTLETIRNASDLPLQWSAGQITCRVGEGCQDTLMMIENGHQVSLVLTKGCTTAADEETSIREHRAGPGLSIISYTRVCRHGDFCNDLSTTAPLWAPPPVTVPGTLRCPLCLSTSGCRNAPEQVCPAGHTHCYDGVLRLRGGDIATNLRVQGCMPQPGCDLLNGTQKIGAMNVSEDCSPQSDPLTCHKGVMLKLGRDFAKNPEEWTSSGNKICNAGELCQETLLLIDVGPQSLLLGSKGCSGAGAEDIVDVTYNSLAPGMVVASYSWFCSSDLCNSADSSGKLINTFPGSAAPTPGDLRCPACVQFSGSCSKDSNFVTCPRGTDRCYNGDLNLQGGGLSATVSIHGCMISSSKTLLGKAKTIGIFSAREMTKGGDDTKPFHPSAAAPGSYLAWVLGLGLFAALLNGGLCPPY